ncbi:hypothetical protein ACIO93_31010 [Streptomyces sp. NPDC087903]|uniref:hypothetical protein n=1 Tax=Streptomyces sp. NPDC087903 TaxID=3365819 RepID=UPI0037FF8300
MKCIVAGHVAVTPSEFAELAFGIDLELFTGPASESDIERTARLDVAREVLAELRATDPEAAAYAQMLLRTSPLAGRPVARRSRRSSQSRRGVRCTAVSGVAA